MNWQTILAFLIGSIYGFLVILGMLWRLIRHPVISTKEVFNRKKRDVMPACLNDPNLGTHGFLHLEDVRLHYVVKGAEGKPLMLFLHGFPEFWYSWRYQLKEFSKDYRVVAVDMRGYGDSDKPSGATNYRIEKLSNDIKQLIPALGYSSCVLVAHDWGGAVAWYFATFNQDMINKLIVMSCPHAAGFRKYMQKSWKQFKMSWYMFFFQMPFLPEFLISLNDYDAIKQTLLGMKSGPNKDKTSDDDVEAYKYSLSRPGGMTGPINYYRAALRYPDEMLDLQFPKIEKPVLLIWEFDNFSSDVRATHPTPLLDDYVIWGKPDMSPSTELATLSGEQCTDFRVKYIENACHWVQMDRPEEVNQLMREFLQ